MRVITLLLACAISAPVFAQRVTVSSSLQESVPVNEWRTLTLDTVREDVGGFASTPETHPTRLTVPAGMGGYYQIDAFTSAQSSHQPVPNPAFYLFWICKNGQVNTSVNAAVLREDVRVSQKQGLSSMQATWSGTLEAGDYIELMFWHYDMERPLSEVYPVFVGIPWFPARATSITMRRVDDAAASVIALSGQSNALKIRPYLADALRSSGKSLSGWQKGAQPISVWDAGQPGWIGLAPTLGPQVKALVWWQGESDGENGVSAGYQSRLASFISRVRVAVGNPDLPVYMIEVGSNPLFAQIGPQQAAYCATDSNCHFIAASALPAYVSHMDAAGYTTVATLLAGMLP